MKYIKYINENENRPEIGDYVILDLSGKYGREYFPYIRDFTDTNVGIVVDYDPSLDNKYLIDYEKKLFRPHDGRSFFPTRFQRNDIVYWSKDMKECELAIADIFMANKYNL